MMEIKKIMTKEEIDRKLLRIATEIAERNIGEKKIAIIGIVRRGVCLASRLKKLIKNQTDAELLVGSIDITFYGQDHQMIEKFPQLNGTDIPFSVDNIPVILVDDILYTGKTIYRAINALLDLGEPSEIQLAAFLDRGRRTFPISADYVGTRVPSSGLERVALHLGEIDGVDEVIIEKKGSDK
ncbi:MAG: bifunctional pyr operon transcriptional regulator/uracil phosphoribosyltransferase PyrR [Clostridia bacterium]|nr:bifunctional pyr operon transcriptional regulator/uracil phosphoribosyltransferase PyrR [Clostridia bacterium]